MSYEPTPREALLIWRMIAAETDAEREPMISKTRPDFKKAQCEGLVNARFITLEERRTTTGRKALHVALSDRAWAWAEGKTDVEILKSRSSVGAEALQGLLRRLLPFLRAQESPLASLFAPPSPAGAAPSTAKGPNADARQDGDSLLALVESACLSLGGERKTRVRLSALRRELSSVDRRALDTALLQLADQGRLVLFRDDNTRGLTDEDHQSALTVGGAPRHLVYLEG